MALDEVDVYVFYRHSKSYWTYCNGRGEDTGRGSRMPDERPTKVIRFRDQATLLVPSEKWIRAMVGADWKTA